MAWRQPVLSQTELLQYAMGCSCKDWFDHELGRFVFASWEHDSPEYVQWPIDPHPNLWSRHSTRRFLKVEVKTPHFSWASVLGYNRRLYTIKKDLNVICTKCRSSLPELYDQHRHWTFWKEWSLSSQWHFSNIFVLVEEASSWSLGPSLECSKDGGLLVFFTNSTHLPTLKWTRRFDPLALHAVSKNCIKMRR